MKDVTNDRSDVVKLAGTNNLTGGGVKHHLQRRVARVDALIRTTLQ